VHPKNLSELAEAKNRTPWKVGTMGEWGASGAPGCRTEEGRSMATKTTGRGLSAWAMALLAAAFAVAALLAAFGAGGAQAQVEESADLAVTKKVKPRVVTVGENQTFTIKVTNERGGIARDVTMTDRLPDQVRFIRASTSRHVPGSCGLVARTVTCELGDLEVGQRVTVKIFVKTTQAGRYRNQAFVTHTTAELEGADNQDRARSRVNRR
jgi:uncharacterized repeat protein (TIGR01451 family)